MAHQPSASALPPPSRLLLPRVRSSDPITSSPRTSRPSRARSPLPLTPDHHHATALQWLGLPLNFDVIDTQLEIDGYQMYAVEKWSASPLPLHCFIIFPSPSALRIVERNRPITVLTVYTGDPSHKVSQFSSPLMLTPTIPHRLLSPPSHPLPLSQKRMLPPNGNKLSSISVVTPVLARNRYFSSPFPPSLSE